MGSKLFMPDFLLNKLRCALREFKRVEKGWKVCLMDLDIWIDPQTIILRQDFRGLLTR